LVADFKCPANAASGRCAGRGRRSFGGMRGSGRVVNGGVRMKDC